MKKIIINVEDGISDLLALSCVREVVKEGRISKEGERMRYCFLTTFATEEGELRVYTHSYTKNDVFTISKV